MVAVLHAESARVVNHDAVADGGGDVVGKITHKATELCAFSADKGTVEDAVAQVQVDILFREADESASGVVARMGRGDFNARTAVV